MLTPDQGGLPSRYRDAGILAELEEHGQKLRFQMPDRTGCSEGETHRAHPLTFISKVGGVRSFCLYEFSYLLSSGIVGVICLSRMEFYLFIIVADYSKLKLGEDVAVMI